MRQSKLHSQLASPQTRSDLFLHKIIFSDPLTPSSCNYMVTHYASPYGYIFTGQRL
jgi:hypothetical protein